MQLILIRHGETIENAEGKVLGHLPGKLSALGISQASGVAAILAPEHVDAIYTSDLQRCVDTTTPIAKQHSTAPVTQDARLREIRLGKLQGLSFGKLTEWVARFKFALYIKPPGGESYADVRKRLFECLNDMLAKYPDGTVIVVTHGGPVRTIFDELDHNHAAKSYDIPNCSIWRVTMDKPI